MRKKLPLIILTLIIFLSCSHQKVNDREKQIAPFEKNAMNAVQLNTLGANEFMKQDYVKAIEYFNEAIKKDSNYSDPYSNRGACKQMMKYNIDEIRQDFGFAAKLDSTNSSPVFNTGSLYIGEGDTINGFKYYEMALAIGEKNKRWNVGYESKIYGAYGKYYLENQNDIKALKYFDQAVKSIPKLHIASFSYLYFNRGVTRYNIGEKIEACNDMTKALEIGYNDSENQISNYCE